MNNEKEIRKLCTKLSAIQATLEHAATVSKWHDSRVAVSTAIDNLKDADEKLNKIIDDLYHFLD